MADSIKTAVAIYAIVHQLLHFEGCAPRGGDTEHGTVQLCQRTAPYQQKISERDNKQTIYYGGIYELFAEGTDPIAAIEVWIRNTLLGSSALAAYVNGRIEPGPIFPGDVKPGIAIVYIDSHDVKGAEGVIFTSRAVYRICVVT